ncbi:bypass of stop codon protein 6 [Trichomonascus vanleenenianus]|uniref:MFS transporter n=1 Tax=Trichomonascus vanleenenianus TaxID=2268995 RepID=UPI003ECA16AF
MLNDEEQIAIASVEDPLFKFADPQETYAAIEVNSEDDSEIDVSPPKESWNNPPENIGKVLITFFGFTMMGLNDSAFGALLPSWEAFYGLTDLKMSIILLAPLFGFLFSAMVNNWAHYKLGRGGVSILGIALQLCNYLTTMSAPAFHFLLLAFSMSGIGAGFTNSSWNAWIGAFDGAHGILGVLHGFYAVGGIVGPAIITLLLEKELPWNNYYMVLATIASVLIFASSFMFRHDNAAAYRQRMKSSKISSESESDEEISTMAAFKVKEVWLLSIMLYAYNGIEVGLSSWIVTYMIRARDGDPKLMGLMSSCLWAGLTFGRIILGFVTGRFKDHHRVVTYYLLAALAFQVVFWVNRYMPIACITIFFIGFFTGPMYPSAMVLATSILPKELHVPGICAASTLAGIGSASFPVLMGAMFGTIGVWTLQPLLFVFIIFLIFLWIKLGSLRRN